MKHKPKKPDRQRLDNSYVTKLPLPAKGAATHWDDDTKAVGFGVRIYATGTRSFFLNYWIEGSERRYTIGQFPRWSVSQARDHAIELRKRIDKGHDPAGQKRERREAATIADLIERYNRDHLPTKSQTKMRLADEKRQLEIIRTSLGSTTKIADIHSGDIGEMHRRITETRGPVRANRVLALASKMFSLSLVALAGERLAWRDAVMGNPCKGISRNREEGREQFFSPPELERIAGALAEYPPEAYDIQKKVGRAAVDALRLMMLTGARPHEAMSATWEQFDKEANFWVKPASTVKQRKTHRLPLSPPAIELVNRLRKQRGSSKWVFPGTLPDEPISTIGHCWRWIRQRAKLAPDENGNEARPYDLRHTFASTAAGSNFGLPIIGKLLGHSHARTTQRYAHLADDPLKVAADRIGTAIHNAGNGAGADIVPIRGGGTS